MQAEETPFEATAPPAVGTTSSSSAATQDEKTVSKPKKRYTLLPGEHTLTLVSEENTKSETEWKLNDKVDAPWTDGELYPGHIAEKHEDGQFTVHFEDGDVRTMSSEGFVRIDKFDKSSPYEAVDGTIITCSEKCSQSYPLSSLFDYKHGVKGSKKNEWRVKVPKPQSAVNDNKNGPKKHVKLTIRFAKNYYISRIHIYTTMPDQSNMMTNYTLHVIPACSASSKLAQKPVEITKLVDTSKEGEGQKEYNIRLYLTAIIVTLPFPVSKKWIGLGAIDIFHKYAEEKSNGQPTNFREDVGSLLKNPIFADCVVVAGSGPDRKSVACHKNILACRSLFFRRMLESSSLSQSPAVKSLPISDRDRSSDGGRPVKRFKLSKREAGLGESKRPLSVTASTETGPISSSSNLLASIPAYSDTKESKFTNGWINTDTKAAQNLQAAAHVLPVSAKMQEILMPDLTYSILMSVLTFIYEDKLSIKDVDEAVELWRTSEKYQFLRLQEQVEKYLESNLTVEKAIGVCRSLRELPLLGSLKELMISYLANEMDHAMVQKDFVSIPKEILHNIFCQRQAQKQIDSALS